MADALIPLYSTTLASATASVTISGIPQGYRDLVIIGTGAGTTNSTNDCYVEFNGDSGANYSYVYMRGNGSVAQSNNGTSHAYFTTFTNGWLSTSLVNFEGTVLDYSATDKHKTVLSRGNSSSEGATASANRWASTAAVTSIKIQIASDSFAAGSTFAVYAIQG